MSKPTPPRHLSTLPAQLDLTPFVGDALCQIGLGQYQVQFHFCGNRNVSVEGRWELRDANSNLIDEAMEHDEREAYKIHRLLGQTVTGVRIEAPRSFTLEFDNGFRLTVIDDSDRYETCQISLGGTLTII
jgi:hypothetical protein